jgi:Sensors of blue-light using FAD
MRQMHGASMADVPCKPDIKSSGHNVRHHLGSKMLERLVYRSKATHKLGSLHLFNLLVQCRKRNLSLGITGHLLYTEEIFVQCIEGPSGSLDALWKSLQRDERHHNVELLAGGPITDREFSDKYDIPGFFPVDAQGMSRAADRCAQWATDQFSDEKLKQPSE